jgi:hypothetical protein
LGYTIVQGGVFYWLASLIPIGLATLIIEIVLLEVMFPVLVPNLSLGIVRKQHVLSLSSTKAEYQATLSASQKSL